jgi:3-dehydroquinate synthase II
MKKLLWVRADLDEDPVLRKKIFTTSLENDILDIIIRKEDLESFSGIGIVNPVESRDGNLIREGSSINRIRIEKGEDQDRAFEIAEKSDIVIVATGDWKVIPVENLIAGFRDKDASLMAEVDNSEEARLFLETLEKGVDGVVLAPGEPEDIIKTKKIFKEMEQEKMELAEAEIVSVVSTGTGDRVCIDTCSMLGIGEGVLIGSQSSGLFLVHSESLESEYVDSRPFRVNAGPVHSYALTPGNKTRYLSDLRVGDPILAVDMDGNTRSVIIGRLKIERRPLLLLKARIRERTYNIILQNAETIRLVSQGEPVSIVNLKEGDRILMRLDEGGRHFGMKIEENIIER